MEWRLIVIQLFVLERCHFVQLGVPATKALVQWNLTGQEDLEGLIVHGDVSSHGFRRLLALRKRHLVGGHRRHQLLKSKLVKRGSRTVVTLGRLAAILGVDAVAVRLVVVDHLGVRSDEGERCRTEVLEVLPSTCLGGSTRFQFFLHTCKECTRGE